MNANTHSMHAHPTQQEHTVHSHSRTHTREQQQLARVHGGIHHISEKRFCVCVRLKINGIQFMHTVCVRARVCVLPEQLMNELRYARARAQTAAHRTVHTRRNRMHTRVLSLHLFRDARTGCAAHCARVHRTTNVTHSRMLRLRPRTNAHLTHTPRTHTLNHACAYYTREYICLRYAIRVPRLCCACRAHARRTSANVSTINNQARARIAKRKTARANVLM